MLLLEITLQQSAVFLDTMPMMVLTTLLHTVMSKVTSIAMVETMRIKNVLDTMIRVIRTLPPNYWGGKKIAFCLTPMVSLILPNAY